MNDKIYVTTVDQAHYGCQKAASSTDLNSCTKIYFTSYLAECKKLTTPCVSAAPIISHSLGTLWLSKSMHWKLTRGNITNMSCMCCGRNCTIKTPQVKIVLSYCGLCSLMRTVMNEQPTLEALIVYDCAVVVHSYGTKLYL